MFCDFFFSRVVGVSTWKDGSSKIKVSDMATTSDEAFAYLLIENDQWSTVDLEVYKNEATFETNSMKKIEKKGCLGKIHKKRLWSMMIWWMDR